MSRSYLLDTDFIDRVALVKQGDNGIGSVHPFACALQLVCVPVISRRMRIITRMQLIGF